MIGRKESAAERDERIVREAGRWEITGRDDAIWPIEPNADDARAYFRALNAAVSILNRISKGGRRAGK